MTTKERTLLVTGASGQLGRQVVELLLAQKAGRVIAGTRSPEKLADLKAKGAEIRRVDFDDAASLDAAFAGVDRLLVISTDEIAKTDVRARQHGAAFTAATKAKVGHIVYTSLVKPDVASPITIAPDHRNSEAALKATGVPYTILRNNLYVDLQLYSLPRAVASGALVAAAGQGKVGFITREDCARAAAGALASTETASRTVDITGPAAVSYEQLASILSEVVGKPVKYVPIDGAALEAGMVSSGMPPPVAKAYASFDIGVAGGWLDVVTDDAKKLGGRTPTSVAEFLKANRAALVAPPAH